MSERALAAETILTTVAVTARQLAAGRTPAPAQYIAGLGVYGILSAITRLAPALEQLCGLFGGLVLLVELVNPTGPAGGGIWKLMAVAKNSTSQAQLAAAAPGVADDQTASYAITTTAGAAPASPAQLV